MKSLGVVTACMHCPWEEYLDSNHRAFCRCGQHREIPTAVAVEGVPDWCPLPDVMIAIRNCDNCENDLICLRCGAKQLEPSHPGQAVTRRHSSENQELR
jgi:hypothetical protein